MNRSPQLPALLGGLRFVVIDELHAFLGGERGLHLQSLLARLRHAPSAGWPTFRVVALSAAIGNGLSAESFEANEASLLLKLLAFAEHTPEPLESSPPARP